jgi:TRAP transporter TAXI family solute receptor
MQGATRRRIAIAVAAAALLSAGAVLAAERFLTILTGGQSGIYYPLGVQLSQIYGKAMPDARLSVQATKASAENLNLLQQGRGELAFAQTDTLADAVRGNAEAGFARPLDKLRLVATIYPNVIQIVATRDSGIRSLADLKGKRVSVGAPRSGTELNARAVLKAAGLGYDDLARVEYLPFAESVDLMKNRQIDATLQSAGLGVASLKDLTLSAPVVFVPVPPEVVARMGADVYSTTVIPAGTYSGQDADVPAAATGNALVTHAGVSEETVYLMTRLVYENLPTLAAGHAAARQIRLDAASAKGPAPLHPGAARYFREQGLLP